VLANSGNETQTLDPGGGVTRVIEVEQDGVKFIRGEAFEKQRRRAGSGESIALRPQQKIQRLEHMHLVIAHQEPLRTP
jgi:hypothetical protein